MTLETTPLIKSPFQVVSSGKSASAKTLVFFPGTDLSIEFMKKDEPVLKALTQSNTLKDTVLLLRKHQVPFRISRLLRIVLILCENNLIQNKDEFLEQLYELKNQAYGWEYPFVKRPFYRTQFLSEGRSPALPEPFVWMAFLGLVFLSLWSLSGSSISLTLDPFVSDMSLLVFYMINSVALLSVGLLEIVFNSLFLGVQRPTYFMISALGVNLSSFEESGGDTKKLKLAGALQFVLLFAYLAFYPWLPGAMPFDETLTQSLSSLLVFLFLMETSPVSKTRLSQGLRYLIHGRVGFLKDSHAANSFYTGLCFVWGMASLFYLVSIALFLFGQVKVLAPIQLATVVFVVTFFGLSLVVDLLKCMDIVLEGTPVEKIFRRPSKDKKFETEAVSQAQDIDKVFKEISLLNHLPDDVKSKLKEKSQFISVEKGRMLCKKGEVRRSMFVLVEGSVAVTKKLNNGEPFFTSLGPGSIFGEVSMFTGKPRTANVRATRASRLLWIQLDKDKDTLSLDPKRFEFLQNRIWLHQALTRSETFRGLPMETIDKVISVGDIKDVETDYMVTKEGEIDRTFFVLVEGKANVVIGDKHVRALERGSAFGELALFYHVPRTATVYVTQPSKIFGINEESFWELMSGHFGLALSIERLRRNYI